MSRHDPFSFIDAEPADALIDGELRSVVAAIVGKAQVRLTQRARRIYADRRLRDRQFGERLFGEPSWDILLDLFAARGEGRAITVSSACIASAVPHTTALRCLDRLERGGLIVRRPHPEDARCRQVEITEMAALTMMSFLEALPQD